MREADGGDWAVRYCHSVVEAARRRQSRLACVGAGCLRSSTTVVTQRLLLPLGGCLMVETRETEVGDERDTGGEAEERGKWQSI